MKKRSERKSTKTWKRVIAFFISLFLLAVQLILLYYSFKSIYHIQWLYILIQAIGLLIVFVIYQNANMSNSYKLTWTILILAVPIYGTTLYILVKNSQHLPKRRIKKITQNVYSSIQDNNVNEVTGDTNATKYISFLKKDTNYNAYNNSKINFFNNGKPLFDDILEALKNAKEYIFLEYFIVVEGILFNQLYEILKQKCAEGVKVRFLYDDVGSVGGLKIKKRRELEKINNLEIVAFAPLGTNMNPMINYRDHRKICVIDGSVGYIGGANIADEYANYIKRFGYWRDNGVKIYGEAVNNLVAMFIETWYMSTREVLSYKDYVKQHEVYHLNNCIQPFGDGPMSLNNISYDLFASMFSKSNSYIYISTPYFIIDDNMIKVLVMAIKMGVDVRILIPGIPDKKTTYALTMAHLGEILEAGGKIYKYTPGFNHAKNIIIDDKYAFCGTINIDYRSLFLHYECGALIINDPEILKIKDDFLRACEESELLTYTKWRKRNIFQRIIAFIFRVFSPLF